MNKIMAALMGMVLVAPAIASANVVLENGYTRIGVNTYGTLGSIGVTSPGILFDPSGNGNYGINDILTPGAPFEIFSIYSADSRLGFSNNDYNTNFSLVSLTSTSTSATWIGTNEAGNLQVKNVYNLKDVNGTQVISIQTTLTNIGNDVLSDLSFLRSLDPDPDVNTNDVYDTVNELISSSQVCATGTATEQTICMYSDDATHDFVAGISQAWSESPLDYLEGEGQVAGYGDHTIGLAAYLGNLEAGQSLTVSYGYSFAATRDGAVNPVPEPSTYAMLGLGLGLLGLASRRRKTA